MGRYSKYVLFVDNISSSTPSRDLEHEFNVCGKIKDLVKDHKLRCALIDFYSAADAKYAWRKMDGFMMDGRKWKVDWATKEDFKVFGWRWTEDTPPRYRSRSRSPYKSRSRSPASPPPASRSPASHPRSASPYRADDR